MVPIIVWLGWVMLVFGALLRTLICGIPLLLGRLRYAVLLQVVISWVGLSFWLAIRPSVAAFIIGFYEFYHAVNVMRLVEKRMHTAYLRLAVRRTWHYLTFQQLIFLGGWWLYARLSIHDTQGVWVVTALILCVLALVLTKVAVDNIASTKLIKTKARYSDRELPTVTLAVPARNETLWLTEILENAVASDYPKLEILVLDDCSQGKTVDIIKSFAHDGVRFVQGTPAPEDHWLHKNWAYQTLYENASGEYIFFAGVDARFEPATIRQLIATMLDKKHAMISVMPYRKSDLLRDDILHPLRNWWELVLPRKLLKRPAVLSTAWVIERKALKKLGSFRAITRSVIPERYFARELSKQNEYAFYRSTQQLGLTYVKGWRQQFATALRTRYPQLHKKPEVVALVTLSVLITWLLPYLFLLFGPTRLLGALTIAVLTAVHCTIEALTKDKRWWLGMVTFPFLVPIEIVLFNVSMYKYEFARIEWKGRNICMPVMHVTPRLPQI